jgi:hypothetical protein
MSTYHFPAKEWHGLPIAPVTRLGRWAVISAVMSGIGWVVALPAIAYGQSDVWVPWVLLLLVGLIRGLMVQSPPPSSRSSRR